MKPRKSKPVKASITKLAKTARTRVSKNSLHRLRLNLKAASASLKPQKRDNISSKSRDMREDRSTRKIKTTRPSKLLFRICAML